MLLLIVVSKLLIVVVDNYMSHTIAIPIALYEYLTIILMSLYLDSLALLFCTPMPMMALYDLMH
jgi:hypothetical protein